MVMASDQNLGCKLVCGRSETKQWRIRFTKGDLAAAAAADEEVAATKHSLT